MKRILPILAAALFLAAPGLASAADDVTGSWKIDGHVLIFSFMITCKFEQHDTKLGGVCYDGGTNKAHPITSGSVLGDKIKWTYQSTYKDRPFDAIYAGSLDGAGRMKGSAQAQGKSGTFSARKQ